MVVFLASLVGLPPTYGFMGKYMLFAKAYEGGLNILLASAVVATLISLFFYFRIVRCMLLNEPNDPHEATTEFTPLLSIPAAMFRRFFVAPEIDLGSSDDNLRPHSAGFSFFMFVLCLLLLLALFFCDSALRQRRQKLSKVSRSRNSEPDSPD
ncbi:MAG: proton-conducting transporter membrane subunit [Planctomycetota bacterium]|nr:proton-conducting transporter membrane subunit [Planctomycetota bacterium]